MSGIFQSPLSRQRQLRKSQTGQRKSQTDSADRLTPRSDEKRAQKLARSRTEFAIPRDDAGLDRVSERAARHQQELWRREAGVQWTGCVGQNGAVLRGVLVFLGELVHGVHIEGGASFTIGRALTGAVGAAAAAEKVHSRTPPSTPGEKRYSTTTRHVRGERGSLGKQNLDIDRRESGMSVSQVELLRRRNTAHDARRRSSLSSHTPLMEVNRDHIKAEEEVDDQQMTGGVSDLVMLELLSLTTSKKNQETDISLVWRICLMIATPSVGSGHHADWATTIAQDILLRILVLKPQLLEVVSVQLCFLLRGGAQQYAGTRYKLDSSDEALAMIAGSSGVLGRVIETLRLVVCANSENSAAGASRTAEKLFFGDIFDALLSDASEGALAGVMASEDAAHASDTQSRYNSELWERLWGHQPTRLASAELLSDICHVSMEHTATDALSLGGGSFMPASIVCVNALASALFSVPHRPALPALLHVCIVNSIACSQQYVDFGQNGIATYGLQSVDVTNAAMVSHAVSSAREQHSVSHSAVRSLLKALRGCCLRHVGNGIATRSRVSGAAATGGGEEWASSAAAPGEAHSNAVTSNTTGSLAFISSIVELCTVGLAGEAVKSSELRGLKNELLRLPMCMSSTAVVQLLGGMASESAKELMRHDGSFESNAPRVNNATGTGAGRGFFSSPPPVYALLPCIKLLGMGVFASAAIEDGAIATIVRFMHESGLGGSSSEAQSVLRAVRIRMLRAITLELTKQREVSEARHQSDAERRDNSVGRLAIAKLLHALFCVGPRRRTGVRVSSRDAKARAAAQAAQAAGFAPATDSTVGPLPPSLGVRSPRRRTRAAGMDEVTGRRGMRSGISASTSSSGGVKVSNRWFQRSDAWRTMSTWLIAHGTDMLAMLIDGRTSGEGGFREERAAMLTLEVIEVVILEHEHGAFEMPLHLAFESASSMASLKLRQALKREAKRNAPSGATNVRALEKNSEVRASSSQKLTSWFYTGISDKMVSQLVRTMHALRAFEAVPAGREAHRVRTLAGLHSNGSISR